MAIPQQAFNALPPLVRRILGSRYAVTPSPAPRVIRFVDKPNPRNGGQLGALPDAFLRILPPQLRRAVQPATAPVPMRRQVLPPPPLRRIAWQEFTPAGKHVVRFVDRPQFTPQLQGLSLSKALKWAGNNLGTVLGGAALIGGAYWAQDAAGGWSQLLTSDGWSRVGDAITGNDSIGTVSIDPGSFDNLPGGHFLDQSMLDLAASGPDVIGEAGESMLDWSNVFTGSEGGGFMDTLQNAALQQNPNFVGPPGYLANYPTSDGAAAAVGAGGSSWLGTALSTVGQLSNIASAFTGSGEAAPPNMYNRAMAATAGARNPGQMAAGITAPKKLLGVDPKSGQYVYSDGTRTTAPIPQPPMGAGMVGSPSGLPSWALPAGLLAGIVVLAMAAGSGGKGK